MSISFDGTTKKTFADVADGEWFMYEGSTYRKLDKHQAIDIDYNLARFKPKDQLDSPEEVLTTEHQGSCLFNDRPAYIHVDVIHYLDTPWKIQSVDPDYTCIPVDFQIRIV